MRSVMRVLILLIINLLLFIKPGEVIAKIYDRCELAHVLRYQHNIPVEHVAIWVCIAQHQSGFDTSAMAQHSDGGYHGMFQISDVYWCSPWGAGKECNIDCAQLRDEYFYDDILCMDKIYNEHQRISGDGYNAWTVYKEYCNYGKSEQYISDCFGANDAVSLTNAINGYQAYQSVNYYARTESYASNSVVHTEIGYKAAKTGKVYERCELARELLYRHQMPMDQIANWVCIAYHESNFNTSAIGRLNTDGSGDHGLFQISDIYWCSPPGKGWVCGLSCAQLEDDDISDDVECMKKIYEEHTRISGDGFNAWAVYQPYCVGRSNAFTDGCFLESDQNEIYKNYVATSAVTQSYFTQTKTHKIVKPSGKVYDRCELARELKYVHNFPDDQIATWVCIAQHESSFNVSAIGRLNADGSGDHGLFQISDIYWCSPPGKGWACALTCSELEDNDLADDIACVKKIYEEHTRISGDGFNAWTVYPRYCKERATKYIDGCFEDGVLKTYKPTTYFPATKQVTKPAKPGKVYDRCELARELKFVYNFPDDQLATWVCIAQYESSYNTSAVGRLNADGSGDHGIFQISDIYWCSPTGNGKACGLTCSELEDGDISNDVECVRKIFEEHKRLSGDGFNAWTVYPRYCKGRTHKYVNGCFDDGVIKTYKPTTYAPVTKPISKYSKPGKVYNRCELAHELKFVHNFPDDQLANWVCIAQHESSFNTSAIGRLNADGSGDHGLFQISDIYWCSPPGRGYACELTCSELEDGDITDDVECVRRIHEEHTRISGDGFNAWTVYPRYCKGRAHKYLDGCFDDGVISTYKPTTYTSVTRPVTKVAKPGKVYDRCELARELKYVHNFPDDQIATWVCIVQHESSYNTSAVGNGDHGLFQISDIYWCSPPGKGYACGLSCAALEDGDITDDIECVRRIHEEHTRISGDGFNAWTVYPRYCKERAHKYTDGCFADGELITFEPPAFKPITSAVPKIRTPGKIYDRCELARELKYIHNFPDDQLATWVCIVQHESNFNTSVVGRLNGDGSENHGLFQISDTYWCSPPNKGWACGLTCSELVDGDINDDVECVRKIYEEHTRISGDGFNAWAVYPRYCKGGAHAYIDGCFDANAFNAYTSSSYYTSTNALSPPAVPAKIYDRCELARELKYVYNFPDDQLATWVCIAQHESNFNTSAVGRLNYDGSGDHGLFQISDIFWCSPPGKGYACGLTCSQLEDNDIRDDVECAQRIYKEHLRISGDGFNAWTVYSQYCKGGADAYIADCFTATTYQTDQQQSYFTSSYQNQQTTSALQQYYPNNPFLISTQSSIIQTTPSTYTNLQHSSSVAGYSNFNQLNTQTTSNLQNTVQTSTVTKTTLQNNVFFDDFFQTVTQKPVTKPPATTTFQNSLFSAPQTYSTYQTSYQPTTQYHSLSPTYTQSAGAHTTTKPGFYNFYTQQASTKHAVASKPDDKLMRTTTKPTATKSTIKSTTSVPKTKSTTVKPTTKQFTFKPFVFPSTTPKSTTTTTKSTSTTKSFFQFPTFTTRSTTRSPFLSNSFFTQKTKKLPSFTSTTIRPTYSTTKTTKRPTTTTTTTPRTTTKTTTIKPKTTTWASIFDRFTTTTLKPTTNRFKFSSFFTSSTTSRPITKSTSTPFRFSLPTLSTKYPTKSIFDSFPTKFTTPKTTTPRTTTRFDFDTFFSQKPLTTPSPRTIRATVPLSTAAQITAKSTPESIARPTTSSTTRLTTRSTPRPNTSTLRSPFEFTTRKSVPITVPTIRTTTAKPPLTTSKTKSPITLSQTTFKPTTRTTIRTSTHSILRPITSTLRSPFEITTRKSVPSTTTIRTTTPRPPSAASTVKTTSSITLSRSTFNNNNLNIIKPKIEITASTPPTTTKKPSPFDLWFDKLRHYTE